MTVTGGGVPDAGPDDADARHVEGRDLHNLLQTEHPRRRGVALRPGITGISAYEGPYRYKGLRGA